MQGFCSCWPAALVTVVLLLAATASAAPIDLINDSSILFTADRPLATRIRTTAFGQDLIIGGVVADRTRDGEYLIAATIQLAIVGAGDAILRTVQCVAQPGLDFDCRALVHPEWGADAANVVRVELRTEALRTVERDQRLEREATRIAEAERREQARRNELAAAATRAAEQERQRKERDAALRRAQEREAAIRAKGWPANITAAVLKGSIVIGMTTEQALAAWGRPHSINETITAAGKSEQWVYGSGQYLYFDNGVLKTVQRSR